MTIQKAPFPWFGGKSRVAHIVWDAFGEVRNYVEPFFGSGAVLLGRPQSPGIETVNDKDCFLANFWRAIKNDPEAVARNADWPVNEADQHARHLWLVNNIDFQERMKTDPDYFDAKVAGWWVHGQCTWIGSGWCEIRARPFKKRPHLGDAGMGVHRQLPHLGDAGMGVHRQLPHLGDAGMGELRLASDLTSGTPEGAFLIEYFRALANRLRRVRVCCGDWKRVLGPTPTTKQGLTGVFLDPPYADTAKRTSKLYAVDDMDVAHEVRRWAIEHGEDPKMRIALCGYEGEHAMPDSWACIPWKARGGYGSQGKGTAGRENSRKERIWFSPNCLRMEVMKVA